MVGHLLQYHAGFAALRGLVEAGALGRLRRLQASRMNLGAIRREEDALWCLAPHDVSMILSLVGAVPDRVTAVAERVLGREAADAATMHLGFPGGATATVGVSWLHPVKEQRLVVVGSLAMAVFDDTLPWESKLTLYRHRVGPGRRVERAEAEPVALVPEEPLLAQCRHFLDCVAHDRRPRTGPEEALRVMAVLDRAARAMVLPRAERAMAVPGAGRVAS
jgi:predicted dehydrogenase